MNLVNFVKKYFFAHIVLYEYIVTKYPPKNIKATPNPANLFNGLLRKYHESVVNNTK